MDRPTLTDICRLAGPQYCRTYGAHMLPSHVRTISDIVACRTPHLGGHVYSCPSCGTMEYAYHSCRNRHCPRCQSERAQIWAESLGDRLLPCPYFFLTFTIPSELRDLARSEQREVYSVLLREAAASVLGLAADPRWIGGRPGIVDVLHTWTRDLAYHPHVHLLVTAGGIAGDCWRFPAHRDFLMPGRVLGRLFREKFHAALAGLGLADRVKPQAWTRRWVVHVQHAGSGREVVSYLSRYIYRVALSNRSIESFDGASVTFSYRKRDDTQSGHMTLPVDAFLARFLQHVLPRRFVKVRYFGLFAPNRAGPLALARRLLELHDAITTPRGKTEEAAAETAPTDAMRTASAERTRNGDRSQSLATRDRSLPTCRACGYVGLIAIELLPRKRGPP